MCDGDLLVLVAFASRSVISENPVQETRSPTPLHYYCKILHTHNRVWITLNKLLYAPLQHPKTNPDIHQGERLCARLLPSVLRVSEKNSSRKLAEQARLPTPWYLIGMRVYE